MVFFETFNSIFSPYCLSAFLVKWILLVISLTFYSIILVDGRVKELLNSLENCHFWLILFKNAWKVKKNNVQALFFSLDLSYVCVSICLYSNTCSNLVLVPKCFLFMFFQNEELIIFLAFYPVEKCRKLKKSTCYGLL